MVCHFSPEGHPTGCGEVAAAPPDAGDALRAAAAAGPEPASSGNAVDAAGTLQIRAATGKISAILGGAVREQLGFG